MKSDDREWRKLQARILAWQAADERRALNAPWSADNARKTQERYNARYEKWCATHGRNPIWQWDYTVVAEVETARGLARVEIKSTAGDKPLERWLHTFTPGYKPPRGPSPKVNDRRYDFSEAVTA